MEAKILLISQELPESGFPCRCTQLEMYYGRKFNERETLVKAIENYMDYYNNERIQRKLRLMTPLEFHEQWQTAA